MRNKVPSRLQTLRVINNVTTEYGVKLIDSRKWYNWLKKRVARKLLARMGVRRVDDFIASNFIFLGKGRGGYLLCPRKLGYSVNISLRIHDLAILAHEMTHCLQSRAVSSNAFRLDYYIHPSNRVLYEVEASCAAADVYHFFGRDEYNQPGKMFDQDWADMYLLTDDHRRVASDMYNAVKHRHSIGRFIEPAGGRVCGSIREEMRP